MMSKLRRVPVFGAMLLPVLVVLEWYQQESEPLRWRVALATAIGVATIALLQWLRGLSWRQRLPVLITIALSAGLAVVAGAIESRVGLFYDVARLLFPVAIGWAMATFLVAPGDSIAAERPQGTGSQARDMLAVGALVFAIVVVASHFSHEWFDVDETLYAIQAARFRELTLVQPVDSALLPFFLPPQTFPVPGGFVTQYPPGWPAILAFLSALGLRSVAGAILAAITVACVYQIGRQLESREAGLAGALLLGTQASFVDQGASYFSHMSSMALISGAALLLLRANRNGTWRPAVGGGLLLGLLVATRPLTGVVLGASTFVWASLVTTSGLKRGVSVAKWSVLGGMLPVLAVLAFNNATTGNPLTFGYSALHGSLHSFGFGERGYVEYDSAMKQVLNVTLFTPVVAARQALDALWFYARTLLPMFLVIPLVVLAVARRVPMRWSVLAVFLALPVVTFFYFTDTSRLLIELLPFVFVGLGVMLARMRRQGMLRNGTIAALVASQALSAGLSLRDQYAVQMDGYAGNGFRVMDEVRAYRDQHGPILVFVRESGDFTTWFMSLNWYNADDFPGDIIVARDLGAENARLASRFPSHRPILATRSAGEIPPLVELRLTPGDTIRRP